MCYERSYMMDVLCEVRGVYYCPLPPALIIMMPLCLASADFANSRKKSALNSSRSSTPSLSVSACRPGHHTSEWWGDSMLHSDKCVASSKVASAYRSHSCGAARSCHAWPLPPNSNCIHPSVASVFCSRLFWPRYPILGCCASSRCGLGRES